MRFDFAWTPAYQRAARPFGVTPDRAWVDVDDESVDAHYGPWRLIVPRTAIRYVEITGPYNFLKTAGPARLGITDGGLTFASNGGRGVLMRFHSRQHSRGPVFWLPHPELTVTVREAARFAALLNGRAN